MVNRRFLLTAGVVLLTFLVTVLVVALLRSGESDSGSVGEPGVAPAVALAPTDTLASPGPQEVEAAIEFERQAAASGSQTSYQQDFRYQITFLDGNNPTIQSGTATFARNENISRLTVQYNNQRETLYYDATTNKVVWCDDTSCWDLETTSPPGFERPGNIWLQGANILSSVDPGLLVSLADLRTTSNTQLQETSKQLGGQTYRCSLLQGVIGETVVQAERCWDDRGAVVWFETTGAYIEQLGKSESGDVSIPFPVGG